VQKNDLQLGIDLPDATDGFDAVPAGWHAMSTNAMA